MHVLFVHRSFPARFGHLAQRLVDRHGCRVTYVSSSPGALTGGIRRLAYQPVGPEAGELMAVAAPFVEAQRHAVGVVEALRRAAAGDASVRPDLVVGPGGLGATHLLAELWPDVPIVNLFDWFYTPTNRPEASDPSTLSERIQARSRTAAGLLDLEAMAGGWCPTEHQRTLFGARHRDRLDVVPEAVDLATWHRVEAPARRLGELELGDARLLTFVARPGEPGRGRAAFMAVAREVVRRTEDVHVVVVAPRRPEVAPPGGAAAAVAADAVVGGPDEDADAVTSPRIHVSGPLRPAALRRVLSLSDLHVHVGAPHALAWSLLDAMACGAPVLATGTPPVRETLTDGVDAVVERMDTVALAERAVELLDDPNRARSVGEAGRAMVAERHALDRVMPRLLDSWSRAAGVDRDRFEAPGVG